MDTRYRVTKGFNDELKLLRVKFIELLVLTLSAVFALFSIDRNPWLLLPAFIVLCDIVFVITTLLWGANRGAITHDANSLDVELKSLSYEFTWCEYVTLILYLVSIATFFYVMIKPHWASIMNAGS